MRPGRVQGIVAFALTAGLCVVVPVTTSRAQRQTPTFRGQVDLIQIDVTVLDRDRRPVRGLKAGDFTLLEDGVPQTVSALVEMSAPDPEGPPDGWMRTIGRDVRMNNAEDGRVLLLILDDGRTPDALNNGLRTDPSWLSPKDAVKSAARAIVERLGPTDLASVIFTVKNKNEQEFTSDRKRLLAAIDGFSPLPIDGDHFNEARAVDTYQAAAKLLGEIPLRRKAVILISPGAPLVLPADVDAANNVPLSERFAEQGREGDNQNKAMKMKVEFIKQEVWQWALRGNVAFYNINPLRMGDLDPEVRRLLNPAAQDTMPSRSFGAPTSGPPRTPVRYDAETVPRYPLDLVTGGFSINRREDLEDGINQIFRETGSYYLLGYSSTNRKNDGKPRSLEVWVSRPDAVARTRAGYVAPKASEVAKPGSPMWKAISGLLPVAEIPMRINVSTFAIPGKKEVALAIVLGLREPLPVGTTNPVAESVRFLTQAFSTNGDKRGPPQYVTADLQLLPNPRGEVKYEVLSLLKLEPGRYHLRLSATSLLQEKSGSIYYDLEVPDYAKAPLSLSGVAISATPALTAGPKDAFAKIIPVRPTTQREFEGHAGSAYLRVYQGGKTPLAPVEMRVRLVDTHDAVLLSTSQTLDAARFDASRAAEFQFDLPVKTLLPGEYLLTFEATMPGAPVARQDVRFIVRPR